jgi:pimeloyl-ACP methyl ester carboxylesterase
LLANSNVDLTKIKAKVLIVNGENDLLLPAISIQPTIEALEAIKNPAIVVTVKKAGHMVPIKHTALFVEEIVNFIESKQ